MTENGKVYGAGANKRFELGLGNSSQCLQPKIYAAVRISALEMYMITKVAAGGFSAALTA